MNLLTYVMHLVGSGAFAYYSAAQIRDSKTRPNILAGFQLAESGSATPQRSLDYTEHS